MAWMNPHYDAEKLGWEILTLDEADMSCEFNTVCFWRTPEGEVYTAADSGCSCPIPFEDYEGETADAIKQKLERVGSYEQAERAVKAWACPDSRSGATICSLDKMQDVLVRLREWFKEVR